MDEPISLRDARAALGRTPCERCGALLSVALEQTVIDGEEARAYVARCERARGTIAQVLDRDALARHSTSLLGRAL